MNHHQNSKFLLFWSLFQVFLRISFERFRQIDKHFVIKNLNLSNTHIMLKVKTQKFIQSSGSKRFVNCFILLHLDVNMRIRWLYASTSAKVSPCVFVLHSSCRLRSVQKSNLWQKFEGISVWHAYEWHDIQYCHRQHQQQPTTTMIWWYNDIDANDFDDDADDDEYVHEIKITCRKNTLANISSR